jgi:hypothetical protein
MPAIENGGVDLEIRPSGLMVAAAGLSVGALKTGFAEGGWALAHAL